MFKFKNTISDPNPNVLEALKEINQKLDFYDPHQYMEISFDGYDDSISISINLDLDTYLNENGGLSTEPEFEMSQLNEILNDDVNTDQIHQIMQKISQNLNLNLQSQGITVIIDEFSQETNVELIIDLYPKNPAKPQNLNNYFNNQIIYHHRLNPKPELLIKTLLILKDQQNKLPNGLAIVGKWWSTFDDLDELKNKKNIIL